MLGGMGVGEQGREMEARDSSRHAEAIETGIARCGKSYFQLKIAAERRPCSSRPAFARAPPMNIWAGPRAAAASTCKATAPPPRTSRLRGELAFL